MTPTPIATPARQIKGILEAKYRNPRSTIETIITRSKYKSSLRHYYQHTQFDPPVLTTINLSISNQNINPIMTLKV